MLRLLKPSIFIDWLAKNLDWGRILHPLISFRTFSFMHPSTCLQRSMTAFHPVSDRGFGEPTFFRYKRVGFPE
jgi:hypothetical protein